MLDTHCHLDFPVFDPDRETVLERARSVGVRGYLVPGVRLRDFDRVAALRGPEIAIAFGLHPGFLADHPADGVVQLERWILEHQPMAVGEIGLDYLLPEEHHAAQWMLLEQQVRLAARHALPLLLHVRRAHDLVLSLLRRLSFAHGGIVHAFGGSLQQAEAYGRLGFCLGLGGVVTHDRARRIRQVAAVMPEEWMVLETDAPDLAPAGHAGERNEPCFLPEVVRVLAELRGVEPEQIVTITTRNARRVLNWPEE
ncbi:MAG: TatD family hydrolase [Magnetococcales bacterium]|nr:TatD family hydrolase [Magnetococcales bacterium]